LAFGDFLLIFAVVFIVIERSVSFSLKYSNHSLKAVGSSV
jgi:hypothetical protein